MSKIWHDTPLGELLAKSEDWITLQPDAHYREVTVRLWGKGVVLRGETTGAEIAAKTRLRVHTDQLIFSRIDARNGAIGIVPPSLNGAVVSGDFPTFNMDRNRLLPAFLGWISKTEPFVNRCRTASEGTTNRIRLKEDHFLKVRIPLPPLDDQRRIVAKIDALAAKIQEAHGLREGASIEADLLFAGSRTDVMQRTLAESPIRLNQVATLARGKFAHRPRNEPRFFGGEHPWIQIGEIESSSKFIRHWTATLNDDGLAISRKFPKGTVLISIAATIGAVGILDFDCCVPDSIVALTPNERSGAEFIYHYMGFLRAHLENLAPKSAQKNINLRILKTLPFPTIPVQEQRRIATYLDGLQAKVDALKTLQAQTAAELDALMPSILDAAFSGRLVAGEAITIPMPAAVAKPASAPAARKPTPFKDDAAILCSLVDALARRNRLTDEFFCQKHLFTLKERGGVAVNSAFVRKVAGPWSHQLKQKAVYAGIKMNWLRWAKGRLVPGPSFQKGLAYAQALLGDKESAVADVVEDLVGFGKNGLERWTTVLKVVRDLEAAGKPVTLGAIQREIDTWPGKRLKEAFTEENVDQTVRKMAKRGWIIVVAEENGNG